MKNRKIILALSLALTLGATMVVGGSLAWFSDTDEATNTFTVGSVEIMQNEVFDETTAELIPVVKTPDHNDPATMKKDNNYIKKEVTVTNTGKNPAYVQTFVAVPAALDNGLLKQHLGNNSDWHAVGTQPAFANVPIVFDHDDDTNTPSITQSFNIYQYRYNAVLAAGATGNTTSQVLSGIYVDAAADIEVYRDDQNVIEHAYFVWNGAEIQTFDLADSGNMKLHVLVATQAIQSQGFADAAAAFDSGAFPAHPWYTAP